VTDAELDDLEAALRSGAMMDRAVWLPLIAEVRRLRFRVSGLEQERIATNDWAARSGTMKTAAQQIEMAANAIRRADLAEKVAEALEAAYRLGTLDESIDEDEVFAALEAWRKAR
jgi:hypothetical protein